MYRCILLSSIFLATQGCLPISSVQPSEVSSSIQKISKNALQKSDQGLPFNEKKTSCPITVKQETQTSRLIGMKGYPTLSFSPDSKFLAATDGSGGSGMAVWNLSDMKNRQVAPLTSWLGELAFSSDSKYLAYSSVQGLITLRNLNNQGVIQLLGHTKAVNTIVFRPGNQYIATSSADNTTRIWDFNGNNILTFTGQSSAQTTDVGLNNNWMSGTLWSPTGKFLMSNLGNSTKIWKFPNHEIANLKGHQGRINSSAFSPDETKVVTASDDKTAKIWEVSGENLLTLTGHKDFVTKAIFSPNGKIILTASADKTVLLWDLNGRILNVLKGHEEAVSNAVFSNDGKCIFTSSIDRTIRIWDLNGQEISKLPGSFVLAVSPNNQYLATTENGTILVWEFQ
jgi:WD40 repeat protein